MKKNIVLILITIFTVSLAACGGGSKSTTIKLPQPIASAGPDLNGIAAQNITSPDVSEVVYINASGSQGTEYTWSLVSYKADENAAQEAPGDYRLTSDKTQITGFFAEKPGIYTLELAVSNGQGVVAKDQVQILIVADADGDGILDKNDPDPDGDGFLAADDAFPQDKNSHLDFDNDGTGNYYNNDVDGDGTDDINDDFPLDASRNKFSTFDESAETANTNDGISVSEDAGQAPVVINGKIYSTSNRTDIDYFKTSWAAGRYSVVLTGASKDMRPTIAIIDAQGTPVPTTRANIPVASNVAAISISILSDGDYFLSITDSSGKSDTSWNYSVRMFQDTDLDGVSDDLEMALDSNHLSADSDSDGVPDFVEIAQGISDWQTFIDADNDGVPTWWDLDSDGDFIPDAVEFITSDDRPDLTAEVIALLNDADKDGIRNIFDTDSDNNGVNDSDEAGLNPTLTLDSDNDFIPDYLDADDDNDGLLDINEPEGQRNTPLQMASSVSNATQTASVLQAIVLQNETMGVANVCRANDNVSLEAIALPSTVDDIWLMIQGKDGFENIKPDSIDGNNLLFTCPDDLGAGLYEVKIIAENVYSNTIFVEFLDNTLPQITSAVVDVASNRLTINGNNLNRKLSINFTGDTAQKNNSSGDENSLTVYIPANAKTGKLYVSDGTFSSNTVWVSLQRSLSGEVDLPEGSTIDVTSLDVSWSPLDDVNPNSNGFFNTTADISEPTVISALMNTSNDEDNPAYVSYMIALALKGDGYLRITPQSTAVALVWQAIGAGELVDEVSHQAVKTLIRDLPETEALVTQLTNELKVNSFAIARPSAQAQSLMRNASLAAAAEIVKQIDDNTLTPPPLPGSKPSMARGKFGEDAKVTPAEVQDISVYEYADSGNIAVENDTQLFLSTQIKAKNDTVLTKHISGYGGMVGPQGYGLLLWASVENYKQPQGQSSYVEVISPGVNTSFEPYLKAAQLSAEQFTAWKYLLIRTTVERVVWPFLAEVLPLDSNDFVNILFTNAPGVVDTVVNKAMQGDATGSVKALVNMVWQDFASIPPGPITQALAKKYGKSLAEKILKKIAAKIGAKFVPGLGQISMAVEVAGHVNNGVNASKAINDLFTTDTVISFDVQFPLELDEVLPGKVKADARNKEFVIQGNGFTEIKRGIWPFTHILKPEIKFIDADGIEVTREPDYISPQGDSMRVTIPGWFMDDVAGPIKVEIHHPTDLNDTFVELDPAVEVVDKVEISSVSPDKGAVLTDVTVYGAGFSNTISDNEVQVGGVNALVTYASDTSLHIVVPGSLSTGSHPVKARSRFDGVWSEWSNSVDFEVVQGNVTITVCDNGGAKDDAFALYVDGVYQGTMYASNGDYCDVYKISLSSDGSHNASLLGVEAPDSIGTYSIEFDGVSNVGGDSLSGSDLVPGVRKYYSFDAVLSSSNQKPRFKLHGFELKRESQASDIEG